MPIHVYGRSNDRGHSSGCSGIILLTLQRARAVKELLRVTHDIGPNTNCVFDIEDVLYVDKLGEQTLGWLNRLGATFIVENVYGKDLCERLHLRRRTSANEVHKGGRAKRRSAQSSPGSSPLFSRPRPPS